MKLNILDQSPIRPRSDKASAIRESICLARNAEVWGYDGYWLAEHHANPYFASSNPEAIIPLLLEATSRIKVVAGGIMIGNYQAYKVAELFSLLNSLFPGRVELGLGASPGAAPNVAAQLAYSADLVESRLVDLHKILSKGIASTQRAFGQKCAESLPAPWYLSGKTNRVAQIAQLGFAFCRPFNGNHNDCAWDISTYRRLYKAAHPSAGIGRVSLGVSVLCSDDAHELEAMKRYTLHVNAIMTKGLEIGFPEVSSYKAKQNLNYENAPWIVGSPDEVCRSLADLQAYCGNDEFTILTVSFDDASRRKSYKLLAKEFGLTEIAR